MSGDKLIQPPLCLPQLVPGGIAHWCDGRVIPSICTRTGRRSEEGEMAKEGSNGRWEGRESGEDGRKGEWGKCEKGEWERWEGRGVGKM